MFLFPAAHGRDFVIDHDTNRVCYWWTLVGRSIMIVLTAYSHSCVVVLFERALHVLLC